ncbi:MAG TPA: WGxxGxxG family protein [Allosphingosinicella sp.]|jgi:MYXO-CTERM domain-containing protein
MRTQFKAALVAAAALALTPATAFAQDAADPANTQYVDRSQQEDDNDFPWGLLGLLGLAGLLGRKRQERDIHVDARKH